MIKGLKDLEYAIKLCRKLGVQSIKIDNVEFHLGHAPEAPKRRKQVKEEVLTPHAPGGITDEVKIPTMTIPSDEMTAEQMLFWSSESATQ